MDEDLDGDEALRRLPRVTFRTRSGTSSPAAYYLATHPRVDSFAKNAGLGLAIPYQAARRWADAVNADGQFGLWTYALVHCPNT